MFIFEGTACEAAESPLEGDDNVPQLVTAPYGNFVQKVEKYETKDADALLLCFLVADIYKYMKKFSVLLQKSFFCCCDYSFVCIRFTSREQTR